MSGRVKRSVKPPPKKVHYSLSQERAICGARSANLTRVRSDITCRACRRLSRRLPASSAPIIPAKYTLVVIERRGKKAVYIDTTEDEAISRYLETNGDTPNTRAEIARIEVIQTTDQFWAAQIWAEAPRRRSQGATAPEHEDRRHR